MGGKCSFWERSASVRGDLSARAGRYCLFAVLSHSVSLPFVFYTVHLQAQKPLMRLNFVSLILAEACKTLIEGKVSLRRYLHPRLHRDSAQDFETFQLFFRELLMLQNVCCVHVDVIQAAISLPAGSTAFSSPPSFPGQKGWSRAASPTCALTCTAQQTCLALAVLPTHTCGQDLSLKKNREIIQLLKGLGGKNITPRVLPPPHVTTCTKYVHREQFYSSFFMRWTFVCKTPPPQNLTIYFGSAYVAITWLFVGFVLQDQRVLHLLAWSKDTNSPEGHS
ncbi:LOW QUALITY PROTEIN: N-acetyllactosaminide beta-1,6-N-acetylglucosaminyl-transferase [Sylvia borin]